MRRKDSSDGFRRKTPSIAIGISGIGNLPLPVDIITYEANRTRFHCRGFYRHSPGRNPKAHVTLEDERRGYRYQRRLALLAFLGGLVGALIAGAVAMLTMKP